MKHDPSSPLYPLLKAAVCKSLFVLSLGLLVSQVTFSNAPLLAQQPQTEDVVVPKDMQQRFRAISGQLRCPTCQGMSILESSASFSIELKRAVKKQIDSGKSDTEIYQFFESRYGPWILRTPPTRGFNLLAWILPIALMILGPIGLWFALWRKRQTIDNYGVRPMEAIVEQLEQELKLLRAKKQG